MTNLCPEFSVGDVLAVLLWNHAVEFLCQPLGGHMQEFMPPIKPSSLLIRVDAVGA